MPRRTNDFQDLVSLIQRAFAPVGARVTDSALTMGVNEKNMREIDVLIEHGGGDYSIRIAVEAKDEKRKMSQERFEAILGKYRTASGIKADEVIVVSRVGFSEPARQRAKAEGITLLTFQEASELQWAQKIPTSITLDVAPRVVGYEFEPAIDDVDTNVLVQEGSFVCARCGKNHGSVKMFVRTALSDRRLLENLRRHAVKSGGNGSANVTWQLPDTVVLSTSNRKYEVDRFRIKLHCVHARGDLKLTAYKYGEDVVHHLKGELAGNQIEFLLSDGVESEVIPLRISHISVAGSHDQAGQSGEAPTDIAVASTPEWFKAWLDETESLLGSVSAKLIRNQRMYDFVNDSDEIIPACAKFYLGKRMGYLQSGIIPFDNWEDLQSQSSRVKSLVQGCDLDLLVCVTPDGGPHDLLANAPFCKVLGSVVDNETLSSLVPPVAMISEAVMEYEYRFYVDSETLPEGNSLETKIIAADGKPLAFSEFCHSLDRAMRENCASSLKARRDEKAVYADVHMEFSTALPEGTVLENPNGKVFPVNYLKGAGGVRGLFGVLDNVRLTQVDSSQVLEMSCSKTGWPTLYLPTRTRPNVSIGSTPPLPEPDRVDIELPPSTINRLVPSSVALRRDKDGSATGPAVQIKKEGEPYRWGLNVSPLKSFR